MEVFTGKKYLKLEKYPHWSSGTDFFVKTILNLGFTKLSVRIKANGYTAKAIDAAERCFATVSPKLRGNINVVDEPEFEKYNAENEIKTGGIQYLYCYNEVGTLVGSLQDMRGLLEHDCVNDKEWSNVLFSRKHNGYIGFSHRSSQLFQIGHKLFDSKWRPELKDITEDMIKRFEKTNEGLNNSEYTVQDKAVECISFRERGYRVIETIEEARQAARNFALYVS